jgi:hypothetical protein
LVCFGLYAASRAVTDALGNSYPQYVALRVIRHRGSITDLDLGARSSTLERLEARGLIRRDRGAGLRERLAGGEFTPLDHLLPRIRTSATVL